MREYIPMLKSWPGKQSGSHYCFGADGKMAGVMNSVMSWIDYEKKKRTQITVGNHMECQYKLMSFGIAEELFLYDHNGNVKQDFVDILIERQRRHEMKQQQEEARMDSIVPTDTVMQQDKQPQQSKQSTFADNGRSETNTKDPSPRATSIMQSSNGTENGNAVKNNEKNQNLPKTSNGSCDKNPLALRDDIIPTDKDVLLGRSAPYRTHPGNVVLSELTKKYFDEFSKSSTASDKTVITWHIVKIIQDEYGGRFLQCDTSGEDIGKWKICKPEHARYKVAYGFRSLVKMQKRQRNYAAAAAASGLPVTMNEPMNNKRPKLESKNCCQNNSNACF